MNQKRWQKSTLMFVCLVFGILVLGARVSSQSSANISVTPASLPTTEPPTLLQFQWDHPDHTASGVSSHPVAVSTAATHTKVITALVDTLVTQGYPTANCGDELEMRVGYDTYLDPDGETLYSLARFNLASISTEATVHTATLWLYLSGSYDYPGYSVPITPHRISSPWAVDTVTWDSRPSYAEAYTSTWVVHGVGVWYPFDVTSLVRHWVAGTYPNYGLILRGPEVYDGWRAFAASETIYPPHLIVAYEQQPHFTLTIVPDTHVVLAGQHTSSILYLTATDGFSQSITLDVAGLPPDTTYEWSANPVTPTASTMLTLTTTPDTPRGVYTFTITGTSAGLVRTTQATLQVSQPDFELSLWPSSRSVWSGGSAEYTAYLTATEGFTTAVMLNIGGLPANATYVWSANPVTPTATTLLTITTSPDTPGGLYTFTVTGTSGGLIHTAQASLRVSEPDFELTLEPSLQSVVAGENTHYTAHLVAVGGFADSVVLDVSGVPSNTLYAWGSNPVEPTASTVLTVATTPDTPAGTHSLTVTGTSGDVVHSAYASLAVMSPISLTETVCLPLVLRSYPTSSDLVYYPWHVALGPPQIAPNALQDTPVSRIALVIGVADYEHMDAGTSTRAGAPGTDLGHTTHDAVKVDSALAMRGSFDGSAGICAPRASEGTTTLFLDTQATKAAIHAAIVNWMDPLENENTVVVIFFSGHGMYAPDDDGDENDPYDEFIVPYEIEWDSVEERWRYEMAIRDDELDSWLSVLESQHIVVLVDSCFSGGVIETSGREAKGLAWQPASQSKVTAAQWQDGLTRDIQGPGRVVLTASAEDQSSWEFGALQDGVFTYYLLEAFRSQGADTNSNGWISAEEAHTYLSPKVDAYVWSQVGEHQNPQISDGVSGEVDLVQLGNPVATCPTW